MSQPSLSISKSQGYSLVLSLVLSLGLLLLLLLAAAPAAHAQPVHKCQVAGKTVYQSTPCPGDEGEKVKIIGGPTAEDRAAAHGRAQREQGRVTDLQHQREADEAAAQRARQQAAQRAQWQDKAAVNQCNRMTSQRDAAYARRNKALNAARRGTGVDAGSREDQSIGQMNSSIAALEQRMKASNCSFTP